MLRSTERLSLSGNSVGVTSHIKTYTLQHLEVFMTYSKLVVELEKLLEQAPREEESCVALIDQIEDLIKKS